MLLWFNFQSDICCRARAEYWIAGSLGILERRGLSVSMYSWMNPSNWKLAENLQVTKDIAAIYINVDEVVYRNYEFLLYYISSFSTSNLRDTLFRKSSNYTQLLVILGLGKQMDLGYFKFPLFPTTAERSGEGREVLMKWFDWFPRAFSKIRHNLTFFA